MSARPAYRLTRAAVPPARRPRLDPAQRAVVRHRGGPLLVLAGPGTGKTTTLVEAVVDRVGEGVDPATLLVLTFSRRAADDLRERVVLRVGRTLAAPAAFTFHSFCLAVVRAAEPLGVPPMRLVSGAERDLRVRDLLAGNATGEGRTVWPAELAPALRTRGFAAELADLLDRARERGLDGPALRRLGEHAGRPAWVAAGTFLAEYLDVLAVRGELDYAGLVQRALAVLASDPGVAARYRAVFVDEYQDTDPAQEALLAQLAGRDRDLVVFGDPDQSIYAFRGADPDRLADFAERFRGGDGKPARVLALGTSRRAGAELAAPARAVAARLPLPGVPVPARRRHRNPRCAGPEPLGPPRVVLYPSSAAEAAGIADIVRRAHAADAVPWSRIAVLVRSGVHGVPPLRRALEAAGVPVTVAADESPLAHEPAVEPLLAALRLLETGLERADPVAVRRLLCSPLARGTAADVRAIGRSLRLRARAAGSPVPSSAALLADALADPRLVAGLPPALTAPLRRLQACLAAGAAVMAAGGSAEEVLWRVWDASGWADRLAAAAQGSGVAARVADRQLDAVLALFAAAARLEERQPRGGAAALLAELEGQELPAGRAPVPGREAVAVMTAHRAKGLEWDVVVVAGVQDGVWPDLRARGGLLAADEVGAAGPRPERSRGALLADERRLFYVALTRARRRLLVTAVAGTGSDGPRPSQLLGELGLPVPPPSTDVPPALSTASLVGRLRRAAADPASSPALRAAAAGELARLAAVRGPDGAPLVPSADPARWWGLWSRTEGPCPVRDPKAPLALSASAVASFTRCPLRWFLEREVGGGGPPSAAAAVGSLVHAAAQRLAAEPAEGVDELEAFVAGAWPAGAFPAPWVAARERAAARQALARLLDWVTANPRRLVGAERAFRLPWGDDVVLTGSVDRLEEDDAGRLHVVDLKTSRTPVSVADAAVDAQLAVYQLVAAAGGLHDTPDTADTAGGHAAEDDPVHGEPVHGEPAHGDQAHRGRAGDGPRDGGSAVPLGGAELVYLRCGAARPAVRRQPAEQAASLAEGLLAAVAEGIRKESFPARPGGHCAACAVRSACPVPPPGPEGGR